MRPSGQLVNGSDVIQKRMAALRSGQRPSAPRVAGMAARWALHGSWIGLRDPKVIPGIVKKLLGSLAQTDYGIDDMDLIAWFSPDVGC